MGGCPGDSRILQDPPTQSLFCRGATSLLCQAGEGRVSGQPLELEHLPVPGWGPSLKTSPAPWDRLPASESWESRWPGITSQKGGSWSWGPQKSHQDSTLSLCRNLSGDGSHTPTCPTLSGCPDLLCAGPRLRLEWPLPLIHAIS